MHAHSCTHLQRGDHALAVLQDIIHLGQQIMPQRNDLELLLQGEVRLVLHSRASHSVEGSCSRNTRALTPGLTQADQGGTTYHHSGYSSVAGVKLRSCFDMPR